MSDAADTSEPFVHPSAVVDPGATIGPGTRIWHFVHVMPEARIGARCVIGQGCFVGPVTIGDGCRIQNNVSVFDGVTLEDEVFVGPVDRTARLPDGQSAPVTDAVIAMERRPG